MNKYLLIILILIFIFVAKHTNAQSNISSEINQTINLSIELDTLVSSEKMSIQSKYRFVEIKFYTPNINTQDQSISPITFIRSEVIFIDDPLDPNYGKYINPKISLNDNLKPGNYQIVIKLQKAMPQLVDTDNSTIVGDIFEINSHKTNPIILTLDNLILGDIAPTAMGDGIINIDDYNLLTSCFGTQISELTCKDRSSADLNEDGIIDGSDYNIMFASIRKLTELGYAAPLFENISTPITEASPALSTIPTITPNDTKQRTDMVKNNISKNNYALYIPLVTASLILIFILLIKRKKISNFADVLLNKHSKKMQRKETTDISIQTKPNFTNKIIDKDFFVKKQTYDSTSKTTVLTLTDDSGPILGYYPQEDITDGFARVIGTLKQEGDKIYIQVTQITPIIS